MIGGAHPSQQGGTIGTPSPEWRYFGGGGGGSDNHNQPQGDGGLGGGGNAGFAGDTSPWPLMARTANPHPNTTEWGLDKTMAPGVGGRGGGGAGNGLIVHLSNKDVSWWFRWIWLCNYQSTIHC